MIRGRHRPPPAQYWYEPLFIVMIYQSVTDWILGYPDQARTSQAAALDFARQVNQPAMEAIVRVYAGAGLDEFLLNVHGVARQRQRHHRTRRSSTT